MIGMLVKDLLIIKRTGKTYLTLLAVFIPLSFIGLYDEAFLGTLSIMLLFMVPITGFAYDEQAGWDKYAVSTPAGRRGVVQGKYLFALIAWLAALVFNIVVYGAASLIAPEKINVGESLLAAVMTLSVGLILLDVLIPLLFQFGSQKSRVMLLVVVGSTMAITLFGIQLRGGVGGLETVLSLLGILIPVVALGGFAISYFTTCAIYDKKEL